MKIKDAQERLRDLRMAIKTYQSMLTVTNGLRLDSATIRLFMRKHEQEIARIEELMHLGELEDQGYDDRY